MGKLDSRQFLLLCAVRFADPLTFTQIFPYINQLLLALRLVHDPANIGFYSGLVESTFAFFQLCSIYHWARLSDTVGRRPVVLVGIYGLALATFLLGFASSLPTILLARALAGMFSGIAAVLHSVLGELTTPANEAFAFSTYGLFWPLGAIVGPIIGGALADPATAYPRQRLFQAPFFRDYPYFLPCFATGLFALAIGLVASRHFYETLPSKRAPSHAPAADADTEADPRACPAPTPTPRVAPLTLRQLLRIPALRALALSGALLCFTATAFDAIFVLVAYTAVSRGGLGFTAQQIATALALAGTASILLQVLVLPPLLRRVAHSRLYTVCMLFWPFTYAALPLLNLLIRYSAAGMFFGREVSGAQTVLRISGKQDMGEVHLGALALWALWSAVTGVMILSRVGCLAYSISLVLVKQAAPTPAALGAANGVVLWAMCLARAGAPAAGSALFALSAARAHTPLGAHAGLAVMVLIALAGAAVSRRIGAAGSGLRADAPGDARAAVGVAEADARGLEWAAGADLRAADGGTEQTAGLLAGADAGAELYLDEEGERPAW